VLPRAPLHQRRAANDDRTSSAIRSVTSELARMTSSVHNIDSQTPRRASAEKRSSTGDETNSRKETTVGLTSTSNAGRQTVSTGDLDSYSSTTSGRGIHTRSEQQIQKKVGQRGKGSGGADTSLLAQIQDDLQSSRERYFAAMDAGSRSTSRSVVCEEDPTTSPALSGNIINTALIDSQVQRL